MAFTPKGITEPADLELVARILSEYTAESLDRDQRACQDAYRNLLRVTAQCESALEAAHAQVAEAEAALLDNCRDIARSEAANASTRISN